MLRAGGPLIASVLLTAAFAGCTGQFAAGEPESLPVTFIYRIEDGASVPRTVHWTVSDTSYFVLDGWFRPVRAFHVLDSQGPPPEPLRSAGRYPLVDAAHGWDIGEFRMESKDRRQHMTVEWNPGQFDLFLGTFAIPHLVLPGDGTAHLNISGLRQEYHVTWLGGPEVRLQPVGSAPIGHTDRPCSLLTDTVVVDLDRSIILRCETRTASGDVAYQLVSPRTAFPPKLRPAAEAPELPATALAMLPRTGPLPPGAQLPLLREGAPLGQIHLRAVETSDGLRDFLGRHPEAILESAEVTGVDDTDVDPTLYRAVRHDYLLRYAGGLGQAYVVGISFHYEHVAGALVREDHSLWRDQAASTSVGFGQDPADSPPALLASLSGTFEVLTAREERAWQLHGMSLTTTRPADDGPWRVVYVFVLHSPHCSDPGEPGCLTATFHVEAVEGRLERASMPSVWGGVFSIGHPRL